MHDNSILVRARIARFVGERVTPAIYRFSAPLTVHAWEVRDEPVPFAEAVGHEFEPFSVGERWGVPWGLSLIHI